MIREKIEQTFAILKEENIDCWLTFVRESTTTHDPAQDLIVGTNVTWHSAFILTATGKSIAIVGSLDKANQEDHGYYDDIRSYVQSVEEILLNTLREINPNKIAINYSLNSPTADGLTHGMYMQLVQYLNKAGMADRLVSSETIINKLRGRKSAGEAERVKASVDLTIEMFDKVGQFIKP